jgi:histidinol-phosphatase (PHP family)
MPSWASFHGGHSTFGGGRGSVRQIAGAAAVRGFSNYGFSEHFTTPPCNIYQADEDLTFLGKRGDWIRDYIDAVQSAQSKHSDDLDIVVGAELEYIRGAEAWTREQLAPWPFQYFVGSVHFVRYDGEDICIDHMRPHVEEALRRAGSPERLYLDYYDHVLELLDWRIAQVIGHLDLIKMLLQPSEQVDTPRIRAKVRAILETMRERNVAVDVNARGLIKPCHAIYPADWILSDAHAIGVAVTLGDDSHRPEDVGANLDQAVAALSRAGYSEMALVSAEGGFEMVPLPTVI